MNNKYLSIIEHGCSFFYTDINNSIKPNFVFDATEKLIFLNSVDINENGFDASSQKLMFDKNNSYPWAYSEDDFYNDLKNTIEAVPPEHREQYRLCYPNYKPSKHERIYFPVVEESIYSDEQILEVIETLYKQKDISVELRDNTIKSLAMIGVYQVPSLSGFNKFYNTSEQARAHKTISDCWVRNNNPLTYKLIIDEN